MRLFAEVGYHAATNAVVAEAAGITRGAMLYHFAGREELVRAAVGHIQDARMALLDSAAAETPRGDDATRHAIEAYWRILPQAPFVAFAELQAVGRTDTMVRAALGPAETAFDRAQLGALAQAGDGARFQASRDLARFLLEGLSRAPLAYDGEVRTEVLLQVVERAVRGLNRKGERQDLWPD